MSKSTDHEKAVYARVRDEGERAGIVRAIALLLFHAAAEQDERRTAKARQFVEAAEWLADVTGVQTVATPDGRMP